MTPALVLSIVTSLFLALGIARFGARKPGYSHVRDTISELGEMGDPNARPVAFGLFLPVGLALVVVALLVRGTASATGSLALCIAIGYIVAAFAPCDPGSPARGSVRQSAHNVGGAVEYIGGTFVLFRLAETGGVIFRIAAAMVVLAIIVFSVPALAAVRGIVQRVAEVALFGGLALALVRG